jgi:hypothetical protein
MTRTLLQGSLSDKSDKAWGSRVQQLCEKGVWEIYSGSVPAGAYLGYVNASGNKTIWLGEEDYEKLKDVEVGDPDMKLNWDKGTVTFGGQEFGIQTGSSDGGALLLVGGVLVAAGAATAVYVYTHPDVWQKAVDAVQTAWNNVTAPVQNAWNSLAEKIPTKESVAAENEAAVNEAGEPAEQAEQTQAAA